MNIKITCQIKHKTLKKKKTDFHYFVSGSDNKDTIIFIHPAFGDHHCFDKQIDYFSAYFRVITFDMSGHGLSKIGSLKDRIILHHTYINEIMKQEAIKSAHIVGVSLGSLLAQYFALKFPDKVLSLTALGGYNINRKQKEVEKMQGKMFLSLLGNFIFSMDNFRKQVASIAVDNEREQARFFESAKGFKRKSLKAMQGLEKFIKKRPHFKRTQPLLILVGDKDNELAIRKAKEWHQEEPKSEFEIIENAGHCANMDNAEKFNPLLMSFLRKNNYNV